VHTHCTGRTCESVRAHTLHAQFPLTAPQKGAAGVITTTAAAAVGGGLDEASYRNLAEARTVLVALYALVSAGVCCVFMCSNMAVCAACLSSL
jgi:hypothetical protein